MAEINETNYDNIDSESSELTAGQMLRLARTTGRRKRELNTIARQLCIKEDFLDALENDDFARIPELVYVLGFARNYAMELELDPYMIVDKIKRQMGLVEEEDAIDAEGEDEAESTTPRVSRVGDFMRRNSKNILIGISVVLVVLMVVIVVSSMRKTETATPVEVVTEVVGTKYRLPIAREYGLKNRDYSAIVLQATGPTWVQIKNAAGHVVFEHSMMAGDVYHVLNGMTATIGNAGALDVWVNGREIPKLGNEHQRLLDVLLTPDSLMKI